MKDLHIHTCYSDGEKDEFEIIEEIIKSGVKEFSICDHDTIEGSKKVYDLLKDNKYDLIFHSGVELSCSYNHVDIHLLYRGFEYDNEELAKLIDKICYLREVKKERMINYVLKIFCF